ncbi:hypothetical protein SISSUDRAFT_587892 [Sistotremastrum suecicum HHB10207 ss-3]|uniref:Uncharacterized protein n=1 Tax=Sistotremastrum suecicum HHB10207 ss-3 TaxID=1314776 RepID=A0A166EKH9_9AGAM|nr:hypothetical protein SISSUDRAFT_587892 [Sistotremastrum suecicum HHB10207 ss-3]
MSMFGRCETGRPKLCQCKESSRSCTILQDFHVPLFLMLRSLRERRHLDPEQWTENSSSIQADYSFTCGTPTTLATWHQRKHWVANNRPKSVSSCGGTWAFGSIFFRRQRFTTVATVTCKIHIMTIIGSSRNPFLQDAPGVRSGPLSLPQFRSLALLAICETNAETGNWLLSCQ